MDNFITALKDFDIAVSLNERAVNLQLQDAWKVWSKKAPGKHFTLDVNPLNARGQRSSTRLTTSLLTPTLSMSGQRMAAREVTTTLILEGGTLSYMSDGEPVEISIDQYVLSIRSELRKRSVSWHQLYEHDAECADDVREHLDAYKLGEGQFSIECLFLTLTNDEALMIPSLALPGGVSLTPETKGKLVECIASWVASSGVDGPNGLLLSASVVPRHAKRPPSLSMADYAFRLVRNTVSGVDANLTHTIDYLGVAVGGNTLPASPEAQDALCSQQGTWPSYRKASGEEGTFAGLMVLRKDLYIDHLLGSLNAALKREVEWMAAENAAHPKDKLKHPELDFLEVLAFARQGDTLVLQGSKHYAWTDNDLKLELDKQLKLKIKLVKGNLIDLEGSLYGHLERDRTTSWDMHSRAKATRTTALGGTLSFLISGEGARCSVVPKFDLTFTPQLDQNEDEGDTWGITQFFTRINNDWDVSIAGDWLSASRDAIIAMLRGVFTGVEMKMGNFAFIPPGEETFTFRDPALNQHLDLSIDVIYRDA